MYMPSFMSIFCMIAILSLYYTTGNGPSGRGRRTAAVLNVYMSESNYVS